MPYCPECGEEIRKQSRFCPECGTDVSDIGSSRSSKSKKISYGKVLIGIIVVGAIVIAGIVFLTGDGQFDTPKSTIRTAVDAINRRNGDLLYRCLSSEVQKRGSKEQLETFLNRAEEMNVKIKIEDISVKKRTNNTASLIVSSIVQGDRESESSQYKYKLIKEDGKWKMDEEFEL